MTISLLGVRRLALDPVTTIISERRLTERQQDCVRLVAKGLSSKEISRELGISPSTVDNHIAAVVIKLNLKNRHELVQMLYKNLSVGGENLDSESIFFTNNSPNNEDLSILADRNKKHIDPIPTYFINMNYEIRLFLYIIILLVTINIFF